MSQKQNGTGAPGGYKKNRTKQSCNFLTPDIQYIPVLYAFVHLYMCTCTYVLFFIYIVVIQTRLILRERLGSFRWHNKLFQLKMKMHDHCKTR